MYQELQTFTYRPDDNEPFFDNRVKVMFQNKYAELNSLVDAMGTTPKFTGIYSLSTRRYHQRLGYAMANIDSLARKLQSYLDHDRWLEEKFNNRSWK